MNPPDIRDIKGLVPIPPAWGWLWLALALLAVAGAVMFWLRRRHRQPDRLVPAAPPPAPDAVALAALERLRADDPPVDPFYTRLSDIVRRYLEAAFGIRAPEQTTEEFLHGVSRRQLLSPAHQDLLSSFLQESDLVKFARLRPGSADRQRAYDAAAGFIRESAAVPAAASASPTRSPSAANG